MHPSEHRNVPLQCRNRGARGLQGWRHRYTSFIRGCKYSQLPAREPRARAFSLLEEPVRSQRRRMGTVCVRERQGRGVGRARRCSPVPSRRMAKPRDAGASGVLMGGRKKKKKDQNEMMCRALTCSSKINEGGREPADPIAMGRGEPVASSLQRCQRRICG